MHLLALLIDDPAVAQNVFVRGHALGGNAGQQAGLEPAAELVGAFHIHISGERSSAASARQTALQVEPESNQTSMMSVSFSQSEAPHSHTSPWA